ncbi:MAG: metalloregulator ArsR/SmtB family transcription factor [Anaerolineae bacterium]
MTILIEQKTKAVELQITTSPAQSVMAALSLLATADAVALESEPWLKSAAKKLSPSDFQANKAVFADFDRKLIPNQLFDRFADYLDQLKRKVDSETADHLRKVWRGVFMPEWDRQNYMQSMANNLNTRDWPTESAESAVQAFLRRPVPDFIGRQLGGVQQLAFCISPYLELQAAKFDSAETLWIFVPSDARKLPMRYEPIQRSEVTRIATALADDARLQILEMLAAFGPMRSQEMIEKLGVSQPTVSRQLKQLKNTQFISEKRDGDASKIFELNPNRLGEVMFMLQTLLSKANARMVLNDVRLDQPAELRKFLNEAGQVHRYPNKLNLQKLVIEYLAPKFEIGKKYSEKEVNELLGQWHTYKDPARLRRDLVDYDYLQRTADGSAYWRE